jgi:hypothetical protein
MSIQPALRQEAEALHSDILAQAGQAVMNGIYITFIVPYL